MADTVLSAQMTEGELYDSIDKELSKGEKRFESFVTNVNNTLGSINANFGDSITKNFNGQIDNMSAKIKQLEIQLNSLTGAKTNISSPTTSTSKASSVVNVNDIDTVYAKEANRALDDVAKKQTQINQMWAQYETENVM
jgi:prefoldin subunit 5